jgi:hypothetical protein
MFELRIVLMMLFKRLFHVSSDFARGPPDSEQRTVCCQGS